MVINFKWTTLEFTICPFSSFETERNVVIVNHVSIKVWVKSEKSVLFHRKISYLHHSTLGFGKSTESHFSTGDLPGCLITSSNSFGLLRPRKHDIYITIGAFKETQAGLWLLRSSRSGDMTELTHPNKKNKSFWKRGSTFTGQIVFPSISPRKPGYDGGATLISGEVEENVRVLSKYEQQKMGNQTHKKKHSVTFSLLGCFLSSRCREEQQRSLPGRQRVSFYHPVSRWQYWTHSGNQPPGGIPP